MCMMADFSLWPMAMLLPPQAVSIRGRSAERTGSLRNHQDPACNGMDWLGTSMHLRETAP
jgi:hypothetical protein